MAVIEGMIRLKSWKADYLHRPDAPRGVTTWDPSVGNEWWATPVDGTITLKSWKGDYLHRPDAPRGVTTWDPSPGNYWTVENADGKVMLKSWKGDYLHRPDVPRGITTWDPSPGNYWTVEQSSVRIGKIVNQVTGRGLAWGSENQVSNPVRLMCLARQQDLWMLLEDGTLHMVSGGDSLHPVSAGDYRKFLAGGTFMPGPGDMINLTDTLSGGWSKAWIFDSEKGTLAVKGPERTKYLCDRDPGGGAEYRSNSYYAFLDDKPPPREECIWQFVF